MSVNIYDGTNLTPIAGKTVPAPTPDYVDEQFNPSTTYSKGMTCIEGNVRYRYKNSTATSGHRPPDTTYWEVYSVASELFHKIEVITTLEGALTDMGSYKRRRVELTASQFQNYSIVTMVLYKTTTSAYGDYIPVGQTTELVTNLLVNDNNYHYMQVFFNPNSPYSTYMAQLQVNPDMSIDIDFLDYTKELDNGKIMLYGIR